MKVLVLLALCLPALLLASPHGDAGGKCKYGLPGTCMSPDVCVRLDRTVVSGACNGGAENRCCVENGIDTGDIGGECKQNVAGMCLTTSACRNLKRTTYTGVCNGDSSQKCCLEVGADPSNPFRNAEEEEEEEVTPNNNGNGQGHNVEEPIQEEEEDESPLELVTPEGADPNVELGDAGGACKKMIPGVCTVPSNCRSWGRQTFSGACSGGSDNVCCLNEGVDPEYPNDRNIGGITMRNWDYPAASTFNSAYEYQCCNNSSTSSNCRNSYSVPDMTSLIQLDVSFGLSMLDLARARAFWSTGHRNEESVAQATAYLENDWNIYAKYILNRKRVRGSSLRGCEMETRVADYLPEVKRGFLIAQYNNARFAFVSQPGVSYYRVTKPAFNSRPTVTTDEVNGSVNQQVANCIPDIVRKIKANCRAKGINASPGTYRGHSWGPYSLDWFLGGGKKEDGFYHHHVVEKFYDAVWEAAGQKNFKFRTLYDDYDVMRTVNMKYGKRLGTYVKYHGPDPFVLHVHMDINCDETF